VHLHALRVSRLTGDVRLLNVLRLSNGKPGARGLMLVNRRSSVGQGGLPKCCVPSPQPNAKQSDGTRYSTVASRGNYDPSELMNSATDVLGMNLYDGWYVKQPADFSVQIDAVHQRFPQREIAISEYGAGASINQHEYPARKPNPSGSWHPEEWQNTLHESIWKQIEVRPFIWGSFIWNMFDFAVDNRSEGDHLGRNDKGLVTYDRKVKKDAFYWYKANWNPEPMVYITSRRYSPRPAGETEVKVYSTCDSVALSVNGMPLAMKTGNGRVFLWNGVGVLEGSNKIEAVGYFKGIKTMDSCEWIGKANESAEKTNRENK
jgi:beta-galactosidase